MRSYPLLAPTLALALAAALSATGAGEPEAPREQGLQAPAAPYTSHQVSGPVTARAVQAVDTSSRREVQAAYRQLWRRADESRPEWTGGDVRTCRPGRLAGSSTNKQLGAINFARLLAGLTPLALDTTTVDQAQAAAIMMTAENTVDHYPPRSWSCWTQVGYDAAGMSNLYQGRRSESNADKIESYLDDWGNINYETGHRRWFLYPYLTAIGIGGTATANVSYLFGQPFNEAAPNPAWVSWPTAGWFPSRLDPRGRWSLSSGDDDADFSRARVKVTFGTERVTGIKLHTPESSPGKPTLVWEMPGEWPASPVGKAVVTVSGITVGDIPDQTTSYAVKFFRSR